MSTTKQIIFNKPYLSGKEVEYMQKAVEKGHISGNGHYTKQCHAWFEKKMPSSKCLLTTSCTDALEMCAILLNLTSDDEVIIPSYTFVSTANAFVLRGVKIVFADSESEQPNLDVSLVETLITQKTKAIVVVHYAGVACDMDAVMALASKYNLAVIEDAAQAIDSYYKGKPLGTIGHLAAFSFHETKNIISGEGGMLVINDMRYEKRAEIIWEKGTNRTAFFKGEVDKYNWVDIGSSFLPSEIIAAFLYAQLEQLEKIQSKRKEIWQRYFTGLQILEEESKAKLPVIPDYATNNAHMFYLDCKKGAVRDALIKHLYDKGVRAVFHYMSLHKSPFYSAKHGDRELPNCDHYSTCLVRLPFYFELEEDQQAFIISEITSFFKNR